MTHVHGPSRLAAARAVGRRRCSGAGFVASKRHAGGGGIEGLIRGCRGRLVVLSLGGRGPFLNGSLDAVASVQHLGVSGAVLDAGPVSLQGSRAPAARGVA